MYVFWLVWSVVAFLAALTLLAYGFRNYGLYWYVVTTQSLLIAFLIALSVAETASQPVAELECSMLTAAMIAIVVTLGVYAFMLFAHVKMILNMSESSRRYPTAALALDTGVGALFLIGATTAVILFYLDACDVVEKVRNPDSMVTYEFWHGGVILILLVVCACVYVLVRSRMKRGSVLKNTDMTIFSCCVMGDPLVLEQSPAEALYEKPQEVPYWISGVTQSPGTSPTHFFAWQVGLLVSVLATIVVGILFANNMLDAAGLYAPTVSKWYVFSAAALTVTIAASMAAFQYFAVRNNKRFASRLEVYLNMVSLGLTGIWLVVLMVSTADPQVTNVPLYAALVLGASNHALCAYLFTQTKSAGEASVSVEPDEANVEEE